MKYTVILLALAIAWLSGCSSTTTHTSPKSWRDISEGMMRQQIVNSIGQPEFTSPSGEIWRSEGWELRIAYDEIGRATNVARMPILK